MQILANLRPCLIRNRGLPGVALSPVKEPTLVYNYRTMQLTLHRMLEQWTEKSGAFCWNPHWICSSMQHEVYTLTSLKRAIYIFSWIRLVHQHSAFVKCFVVNAWSSLVINLLNYPSLLACENP